MRPFVVTWASPTTASIASVQDVLAGNQFVYLSPQSSIAPGTTVGSNYPYSIGLSPNYTTSLYIAAATNTERSISFTSTLNNSAATITIVGQNLLGNTISTTLAGPNINTVESSVFFHKVTSITADINLYNVSVGFGNAGATVWYTADQHLSNSKYSISYDITGTVSLTPQQTLDRIYTYTEGNQVITNPTAYPINAAGVTPTGLTFPVTADTMFSILYPVMGVRTLVGNTTTGSFTMTILQQGLELKD